ncbi:hypothetical protein [Planctomycetes bacterium Poly30]|uniref:hypothetical protein n=1 Tax=Saltatorellus ferox TaxID=2528018 RepID=UPI0011A26D5B
MKEVSTERRAGEAEPGSPPEEQPEVGRLFAFTFLTAASYVVMRSVAVSLFLSRIGPAALPALLAIAALSVIVVAWISRGVTQRLSGRKVAIASWCMLAALTLGLLFLVQGRYHHSLPVLGGLYLLVEIRGCLNTIHSVTLMNEAFAEGRSKRPYALVSAGAPTAGILIGATIGFEGHLLPLSSWLLIAALLDVGVIVLLAMRPTLRAGSVRDPGADQPAATASAASAASRTARTFSPDRARRFRLRMSLLVAGQVLVLTLLGYQWKLVVANYFHADEVAMAEYIALFYAATDALIVLIQFFLAGRLLDRYGVRPQLILLPAVLLLIGLATLGASTPLGWLVLLTMGRGALVLRRGLHDPALASTYRVLGRRNARDTVMLTNGVIKPGTEAVTSIVIFLGAATLSGLTLTWLWLALTIPWILIALRFTQSLRRPKHGFKASM